MKRCVLILLCLTLLAGGCTIFKQEEKEEKESWVEGAMLKVGDQQIDYREGLVYLDATRKEYEQYYGTDIWNYRIKTNGDTLGITVKEEVLEAIIYIKTVCMRANELNVYLSEDELKSVDDQAAEYMRTLEGSDILEKGVNENVVRRIYSDNYLARKVFEQATLNIDTNIPDEIACQHHFYSVALRNSKIGPNGEKVEYTEDKKEEIKKQLYEMREKWKTYTDMYSYAKTKTEDLSMLELMIGKGELENKELENMLMALGDGEFSEVFEGEDFFYIFYCDTAFDIDATQEKKEEIIAERQKQAFEELYEKWREETEIEVNQTVWDEVDVFTVKVKDE